MREEPLVLNGLNDRSVTRALSNPNRQRLLELISGRDYVSTTELLSQSGLAWGTLLYHLDILMRANLVGSSLAGKKRVYFRKKGLAPNQLSLEVMVSPNLGRIINALLERSGRCQQEFQAATGLSQRMCSYYLQKRQERGFIVRQPDGNRARYHPTPQLLEAFPQAQQASAATVTVTERAL
jgi:predicted transcriptional regulator